MAYDEATVLVRDRAYQIWEDEGRPEGKADTHWEQAQRIVDDEDNRPAARNRSKSGKAPAGKPRKKTTKSPAKAGKSAAVSKQPFTSSRSR